VFLSLGVMGNVNMQTPTWHFTQATALRKQTLLFTSSFPPKQTRAFLTWESQRDRLVSLHPFCQLIRKQGYVCVAVQCPACPLGITYGLGSPEPLARRWIRHTAASLFAIVIRIKVKSTSSSSCRAFSFVALLSCARLEMGTFLFLFCCLSESLEDQLTVSTLVINILCLCLYFRRDLKCLEQ